MACVLPLARAEAEGQGAPTEMAATAARLSLLASGCVASPNLSMLAVANRQLKSMTT